MKRTIYRLVAVTTFLFVLASHTSTTLKAAEAVKTFETTSNDTDYSISKR